jgi:hypothetical protein
MESMSDECTIEITLDTPRTVGMIIDYWNKLLEEYSADLVEKQA